MANGGRRFDVVIVGHSPLVVSVYGPVTDAFSRQSMPTYTANSRLRVGAHPRINELSPLSEERQYNHLKKVEMPNSFNVGCCSWLHSDALAPEQDKDIRIEEIAAERFNS